MKIVIAPQGFKGNLSALQVGQAINQGIKRIVPGAITIIKPMADGGEGTVQALVEATNGTLKKTEVTDPLGRHIIAGWGILGDRATAVIEMSAASGLTLVPLDKRNPLLTTSYGVGELILAALEDGCRKIIIGIGGSATNDAGAGMVQALGLRLLNSQGREIAAGAGALTELQNIDATRLDHRLDDCEISVACDVNNPLCGPCGASAVYGPQKGASSEMVQQLDAALQHFADIIQKQIGLDMRNVPGAGAAGGLGMGLMVFLNAELKSGVDIVMEYTDLKKDLKDADLVFTAEGRIDSQTACGKVPAGVAQKAKEFNLPVIAIAGEIADDYRVIYDHGIDAVFSIAPGPISLHYSMANAIRLLADTAENALKLFICSRQAVKGRRK